MRLSKFFRKLDFIGERRKREQEERARELVLASHLALLNLTVAMDADKDIADPDAREPTKSQRRRAFRQQQEYREFVDKMRSSPMEYARKTGYGDLFGLPPEEPPKKRNPEEVIRDGMAAAKRTLRSIFGSGED